MRLARNVRSTAGYTVSRGDNVDVGVMEIRGGLWRFSVNCTYEMVLSATSSAFDVSVREPRDWWLGKGLEFTESPSLQNGGSMRP